MATTTIEHRHREPSASPAETRRRLLRHRLDTISTRTLVTIVGVSIAIIALTTTAIVVRGVGRFESIGVDREQWAATEAHVHHIGNIATSQFLAVADVGLGTASDTFTFDDREIQTHVDELITSAAAIAGAETFGGLDTALRRAAADFEASLAVATRSDPEDLVGAGGALVGLERSFADLQTALREFSEEMNAAESLRVHGLVDRADAALFALIAVFLIAGSGLGLAWRLGRRIRLREATLLDEVSTERQLMQAVIDALPDSIAWKDTDSRLQGLNAALQRRMANHDINASIGQRISEADLTEEIAEYIAHVEEVERRVVEVGEPATNLQMRRPELNGKSKEVLRTVVPLRRDNEIVGVISTTRDITEVVELERSLASARRLETIGQLSAGVAHEINTPVQYVTDNTAFLGKSFNSLLGAVQALTGLAELQDPEAVALIRKNADLDFLLEDIPDAIDQSREGLDQITHIIRAMKAFAHPGGEIVPTDVNALISTTVDISRNEWKYHATVELDLADDLPQPECDEGQVKQVLLNMIINASDAIADAGDTKGVISITTRADEEAVVIRIADTGTGIPDDVREHMFERFFTTKPIGHGSGQGLAICYDAVAAHGGQIAVESQVGSGTTFTIKLPLRRRGDAGSPAPRSSQ